MIVTITDDFDLEKIINSGQCFRPRKLSNGSFLFITGDKYLIIKEVGEQSFGVNCNEEDWDNVWVPYFDLNTNYASIRKKVHEDDSFMIESALVSAGIRILRQNKWEMLISYIISQRKSIPAIRSSVEKLCSRYGHVIAEVEDEIIYSFPSADEMKNATDEELAACGLGYRVSYIKDAVITVNSGHMHLEDMTALDDETLFEELKKVRGIGDKVANCVLLFAYHRTGRAPVDTWIQKVMIEKYNGENPFTVYGDEAGIMQQYVFYYVQNRKGLG